MESDNESVIGDTSTVATEVTDASDVLDDVEDAEDAGGDWLEPEEPEDDPIHEIIHIIPREKRCTSEVLDPAGEMANVLLTRIQQIENGGSFHGIDITGCRNATDIAKRELIMGKTPLTVRRIVKIKGNEKWVEEWDVSEMVIRSRELKLELGLLGHE